jgi:hypothetical protein
MCIKFRKLAARQRGVGTTKGDVLHNWTEGPFDTERKARENLQGQFAVPVIESL